MADAAPQPRAAMAAIRRTLVVLAANNSGSTVLRNAIAQSTGCWHLPREAQHVPGFGGPSTRGEGTRLIWAASEDRLARHADPARYDWVRSWAAWCEAARAQRVDSEALVLSSPPFLFLAESLARALPDPRFVVLVRNPYAVAAGILKRADQQALRAGEDIRRLAAAHILACMERQRENVTSLGERAILLRYEDMCADPVVAAGRIERHCPSFAGLDLAGAVPVKGLTNEPLRDMNGDQLALLDESDLAVLEEPFARGADVLMHFGYDAAPPVLPSPD